MLSASVTIDSPLRALTRVRIRLALPRLCFVRAPLLPSSPSSPSCSASLPHSYSRFLSNTTATLYSLTGALNKIPVAIIGMIAFAEPTNAKNLLSIVIGLGAGVLFVFAKSHGK